MRQQQRSKKMARIPTTAVFGKDGDRVVVNTSDVADWAKRGYRPKAEQTKAEQPKVAVGRQAGK